jgi:hypothetical protein
MGHSMGYPIASLQKFVKKIDSKSKKTQFLIFDLFPYFLIRDSFFLVLGNSNLLKQQINLKAEKISVLIFEFSDSQIKKIKKKLFVKTFFFQF